MDDQDVLFDSVNLHDIAGAAVVDHDFNKLPNRELMINKLARANKSILTTAEFKDKEVTVNLHLKGCDRGEAEEVLRELKSNLRTVNGELKVNQAETVVIYSNATMNSVEIEWFSNKIKVVVTFIVADPIGREDATSNLITATNNTALTASVATSNGGSFDAEALITVTVNTVTVGTNKTISIKNSETGQGISVTRTWVTDDILQIDVPNRVVRVNGNFVDFEGQFPLFEPGTGSLSYVDDFTARDVDITATYSKAYI